MNLSAIVADIAAEMAEAEGEVLDFLLVSFLCCLLVKFLILSLLFRGFFVIEVIERICYRGIRSFQS